MRVASSDWCASRMVVSVTSTRFSARIQARKRFGPVAVEPLLGAGAGQRVEARRRHGQPIGGGLRAPTRVRVAVDGDVGDVGEELGRAVAALDRFEQLRRRVDEARRVAGVAEARMIDDVLEERQIGGDAADAEFAQRPVHARDRLGRRRRPGGDLLQQRIVEARDDRAGIGGAAVEPDAEARGAAIGGDAPIVGDEILLRDLRW